jgi:hypothetical protein
MDKLSISLEYCYGIKKLDVEFDFSNNGPVFSIYAPNGVMKTSFANTFKDLSEGNNSQDRVRPENATTRKIRDEGGNEVDRASIFVIEPYNEKFKSDRISTLLVNEDLRKKYEKIYEEIDKKVDQLVGELKKTSGLKKEILEEFSSAITHDRKDFFRAIGRVQQEVEQEADSPLADVIYSHIFNEKTEAILLDEKFRQNVKQYIEKYDELLNRSTFFRKGVFTHNNASDIAKMLKQNGFFKADHSVFIRINGEKREIGSEQALEAAIEEEKSRILTDEGLKSSFEEIDKQLIKNTDLKQFRTCLENNPVLISELDSPERLRQKLWVSYLVRAKESYLALILVHNIGKEEIAKIVEQAKNEITKWAGVIHIFNERFSVPFLVSMDNQEDVILRSGTPTIRFDFLEDPEDKDSPAIRIEEDHLLRVLSNGEKRALYILNIIFEVEARKEAGQNTLFIVDDVADSFDYKNKYAIIEYLRDVAEEPLFKQIILSHNFDFHRTVSGRLNLRRSNRMIASKLSGDIQLEKEIYQNSAPFKHWKDHLNDEAMLIASIPFLRNLAEFSGDDASFLRLTSLLHYKVDTDQFTIKELQDLIKQILHDQNNLSLNNPAMLVKNVIYQVAERICGNAIETASLEEKIVLSIASRLKIEEFMVAKINDRPFWEGINRSQTINLLKRYKADFALEKDKIRVLERVNLMTPENIHLNSFMYEPILDLSAHHLKKLYSAVKGL